MIELIKVITAIFIFMLVFVIIITGNRKLFLASLLMAMIIVVFLAISTALTTNQPNDLVQFEDGSYLFKVPLVILFISISGMITFYWYKELEENEVGRKNDL